MVLTSKPVLPPFSDIISLVKTVLGVLSGGKV
jgi:hypothetical protein